MPPEIRNKTYTWLLILLQVVAASSWANFQSRAHAYENHGIKPANYRRGLVISAALKPLLCTPATETLKQWQNDAPNDTLYADGLLECMEWINSELNDAVFSGMSEEEQRSIDSWAFTVSQEGPPEPGNPSSEDSGCILCGVLVTKVGPGNDADSRFYWPTLRLLHLALRPVSNLTEAAPWILRSAEDAIEFCDQHSLRYFKHLSKKSMFFLKALGVFSTITRFLGWTILI